MKKIKNILIYALPGLMALASCSSDFKNEADANPMGSVTFKVSTQAQIPYLSVATKTDATRELPQGLIPETADFSLSIANADGQVSQYENVSLYDAPLMEAGTYTATFACGDPDAEGPEAACFGCEHEFEVIARYNYEKEVKLALTNSVVSVRLTQWFTDYYPTYDIIFETESGYQIEINDESLAAGVESQAHFVKAGTTLYFSGTAVKTNGAEVTFPRTAIAQTKARTWQTLSVDASQASSGSISIVLDDTPVEIKEIAVELNPDA